jgi:PIN domain nuclease of toxin-antitoxin system
VARAEEPALTYLDTHVVMWLYDGLVERLSGAAKEAIESGRLIICGMVELELQFLREIGRIRPSPQEVIGALSGSIGLSRSEQVFSRVAVEACRMSWTRDPFDRLIVAEAKLAEGVLVTRDELIRDNFAGAVW